MPQLTLRIPDQLASELKAAARQRAMSVNGFASAVLTAAVDPELGETEMDRLRGRLARAGLLAEVEPQRGTSRPDADQVSAARLRAGQGRALSELVSEDRN